MKKFLLSVCMIAVSSLSAFSQTIYSSDNDIYGLSGKNSDVKKVTFSIEAGLGNEVQVGLRAHLNFNKYLTWDMLGVQYAFDLWGNSKRRMNGDYSYDRWTFDTTNEIAITTGIRAFLPLGRSVKLFAALNLGYGQVWAEEEQMYLRNEYYGGYYTHSRYTYDYFFNSHPGFLTDLSAGICFSKFSLSYGFQHVTSDYSHMDHVGRISFTF